MSSAAGVCISYRDLLARYELALYRTLDPALGELCAQKQALLQDGVATKAVHSLFAFDYGLLEPHVYRLARADFVFSRRFPGIRYLQKRFDQYADAFTTAQRQQLLPRSGSESYWTPAHRFAATHYVASISSDDGPRMWQIESKLALMQAHFTQPEVLRDPLAQRTALLRLGSLLGATRHYAPQLAARLETNGAPVILNKTEANWAYPAEQDVADQYVSPRKIWGNL